MIWDRGITARCPRYRSLRHGRQLYSIDAVGSHAEMTVVISSLLNAWPSLLSLLFFFIVDDNWTRHLFFFYRPPLLVQSFLILLAFPLVLYSWVYEQPGPVVNQPSKLLVNPIKETYLPFKQMLIRCNGKRIACFILLTMSCIFITFVNCFNCFMRLISYLYLWGLG